MSGGTAKQPNILEIRRFYQYLREIYKLFHSAIRISWAPLDDALSCLLLPCQFIIKEPCCATLTFKSIQPSKTSIYKMSLYERFQT